MARRPGGQPLSPAEVARRPVVATARRYELFLSPSASRSIEEIRAALDARTTPEAIRLALAVARLVIVEVRRGGRVYIKRQGGGEVEVLVPIPAEAA